MSPKVLHVLISGSQLLMMFWDVLGGRDYQEVGLWRELALLPALTPVTDRLKHVQAAAALHLASCFLPQLASWIGSQNTSFLPK